MMQLTPTGQFINIIHFMSEVVLPPLGEEGPPTPQLRIACMPNMTEFHQTLYHPNYQRTNEPRAATCPACKKTQAFLKAMEAVPRG